VDPLAGDPFAPDDAVFLVCARAGAGLPGGLGLNRHIFSTAVLLLDPAPLVPDRRAGFDQFISVLG
jgi:hypothetical protein